MSIDKKPIVHFIGIGGIGMSALARWFLAKKWIVSGSDLVESGITKELKKEGVRVRYKHQKSNLPKRVEMVVMSAAVTDDNPELIEARKRNLKPLTYPQAVGCLTDVYDVVGVAGSHGKSTTTSMIALMMTQAKLDPNVIVGTNLKEFQDKNFRLGKSKWLVLEADEYREAFSHYRTKIAVVTNIDREHLDYYKNLRDVGRGFLRFLSKVQPGGMLVLNRDDKNLFNLRKKIEANAKSKKIKIFWYSVKQKEAKLLEKSLTLPGRHNLSNALAAYTVGVRVLGLPLEQVITSLSQYRGSWRRMEYKGKMKTRERVEVYDDYGHHPTEIRATLQAFREKYPHSKIVCVYEPHQTKRLEMLYEYFKDAFLEADLLVILPIYGVAGRDSKRSKHTSYTLVRDIRKKYPKELVEYLDTTNNLKRDLMGLMKKHFSPLPSLVVVMMGAGDIFKLTPKLLR
ncbi:MAG: UDP-N-acetylmuramate--L-alanine ligase [Anaplasmataceae bacterium]|nr:UDP-N-acetylmuramate--L-alanine ligase [Anaplasmataceae bacterium]